MFISFLQVIDMVAFLLWSSLRLFAWVLRAPKLGEWAKLRCRWCLALIDAEEITCQKPRWSWGLYLHLVEICRQYGLDDPYDIVRWYNQFSRSFSPEQMARLLVNDYHMDSERALELLTVMAREGVLRKNPSIWLTPGIGVYCLGRRRSLNQPGFQAMTTQRVV